MGMAVITTPVMLERDIHKITSLDCVLQGYETIQSAMWLQIFQRNMLPVRMLLQKTSYLLKYIDYQNPEDHNQLDIGRSMYHFLQYIYIPMRYTM